MPPFVDNTVTRFPNGVTNNDSSSLFNSLKMSDPTRYHTFWEDFDYYTAANWVVTAVGAGTAALANGDGGALLITNAAADDNSVFLQKVGASFLLTPGKKTFFESRLQVSDAVQSDVIVGLQIIDTTPFDATDGVYFLKPDGAATINIISRLNATTGSTSALAIASMVSATYMTLGWFYDGIDRIYYAVNDAVLGSLDGGALFLPDSILTVSFGMQNGEAVVKTALFDYIFAAQER